MTTLCLQARYLSWHVSFPRFFFYFMQSIDLEVNRVFRHMQYRKDIAQLLASRTCLPEGKYVRSTLQ